MANGDKIHDRHSDSSLVTTTTGADQQIISTPLPTNFKGIWRVADAASGDNAGKLALRFIPLGPNPAAAFEGFLEDVPDAVLTPTQRQKLRAHLKKCLAYWQTQQGVTGTPDADPGEPT